MRAYSRLTTHTFSPLLILVAVWGLGCASAERRYLASIRHNFPPPQPDLTKLQQPRSPEEALALYRRYVITPYRLERVGEWAFTIGEAPQGYKEKAMRHYLGYSSAGKLGGGMTLQIIGDVFVGVGGGVGAFVPPASSLLWPGVIVQTGGSALRESGKNDTYRAVIEYNLNLGERLGFNLRSFAPGE